MISFEAKWWRLPSWIYYSIAVITALAALTARFQLEELFMRDEALFLFATLAVAISSFLGGLGPGLLCAILCVVGGTYLFLDPHYSFAIESGADRVSLAGFGAVWGFISMICDYMRRVTLRLAKESRAVLENESQLDSILGSVTDGFFSVDRDWKITRINRTFAEMVNQEEGSLKGAYLWDVLSGEPYYETRIRMTESLRKGEPFTTDFKDPDADRWLHIRGFPMQYGMFVYVQDVTHRKHLEESSERMLEAERTARSDAESMNRMKDEFVATLSHELRTPLTTILGWTEVLLRQNDLDSKMQEGLQAIERSVRHQSQLISDLLDMSRIASGKLKLEIEFVNLADTAYEAVELARPTAESKNIDLEVEVRDEQTIVRGDPQRLYQVLTNLISNAIKFTPRGGKVRVEVFAAESCAHIAVTDTGEGIDPEFLPFLFDRFRQGDSSSTRRHGGLGLGLSIVRQLVELHGGEVRAMSGGKGKGSRFEFSLPIAVVPSTMLFEPSPREASLPTLAGLRILAVDDDEGTRQLIFQVLTDAGAEIVTAESGKDALEKLENAPRFDVILSDIGMPEMDGYQFLRTARAKFDKIGELPPAIALTAFAHEKDFVLSAEAGFTHHLTKPVEISRLIRTIHAVYDAELNHRAQH